MDKERNERKWAREDADDFHYDLKDFRREISLPVYNKSFEDWRKLKSRIEKANHEFFTTSNRWIKKEGLDLEEANYRFVEITIELAKKWRHSEENRVELQQHFKDICTTNYERRVTAEHWLKMAIIKKSDEEG